MSQMAEGQGFEPWKGVNPCWFSRPVHSTALPTLRWFEWMRIVVRLVGVRQLFFYVYLTFFRVFDW